MNMLAFDPYNYKSIQANLSFRARDVEYEIYFRYSEIVAVATRKGMEISIKYNAKYMPMIRTVAFFIRETKTDPSFTWDYEPIPPEDLTEAADAAIIDYASALIDRKLKI